MKIGDLLAKVTNVTKSKTFKNIIFFIGWLILFTGIFAGVDLFFQYLNNDRSIAVVNGTMIPRKEYYKATDLSYGPVIVNSLITQEIVQQEAAKQNITISDQEVDDIITQYAEQLGGQENLEASLELYNTNLDQLREDIKLQKITMKLYEQSINPTEDVLKAFFEENKVAFYGEGTTATYEEKSQEIRDAYIATEYTANEAQWLQEMQNQYRIQNNLTSKPEYSLFGSIKNIINNLKKDIVEETTI
ncbi:MAG TPA: hypothetical protein PKJ86_01235 [Candidatus Dojkabacteria bacterium]|nr:hypothetical protein [Candidatus Dojkabacteria bacterium]HQG57550.1 hypothetical protein [Candidatus Dojkabacteria bacterium]